MSTFESNEIRGRKYVQALFDNLGTEVTFTEGQFAVYDFSFVEVW